MTVDIHVHIGSFPSIEGAGDLLTTRADVAGFRTRHPELYQEFAHEDPLDNSGRLIEVMDHYEVEKALIQPRPGVSNEFVAELARANPDRLVPLALPTPWPVPGDEPAVTADRTLGRRTAQALEHCFDTLGMRAAGEFYVRRVTSSVNPDEIADDFSDSMEVLSRHQAPLEIPTAWTQFPGGLFYGDPIWVDELAARFPEVPIILTKMGRGIDRYFEASLVVAQRNRNVYFDTSDTTPDHLRLALERVGAERVLFGTDWSATWQYLKHPGSVHATALSTLDAATTDPAVKRAVLSENATRLFATAIG